MVRRFPRLLYPLLLIALMVGVGVALYLDEREGREQVHRLGEPRPGGWVELGVSAEEVDTGGRQMTMYVVPVLHGAVATRFGSTGRDRSLRIMASSLSTTMLVVRPGHVPNPGLVKVELEQGPETDYPFDRYRASVSWSASSAGVSVPLVLAFNDADPFFTVNPRGIASADGALLLDARIRRSRSSLILALFMIAAMWALALAVLGGAQVLIRKRQGLVWPALGWMAATLFALVGLRTAAPGSPPIGSLIDYVAFFWAEAIIAASLALAVVSGIRSERHSA